MGSKIHVLERHVAELIAAGEVVEKPGAVIKELVENSIDALAKRVVVEIRDGGKTFMRVTDDGGGISLADVKKAFLRHATSKVKNAQDLESISTLGFRGEALASICAVSKIQMLTKTSEAQLGIKYEICGGEEVSLTDWGCPFGTTIIVKDLFYNVPARLKFLKKESAEASAIAGLMSRIALSHTEVSFTFIKNGKQGLLTPGDGSLQSGIYAVYGKEAALSMMPVSHDFEGINISGYISKPENARSNRSMQHFFINGRYVQSAVLSSAVDQAFAPFLMVKKFAHCVLHIRVPYDCVDVNIHPSKTQVRFSDEKLIFRAMYSATKTALNMQDRYKNFIISPSQPPSTTKPETREEAYFEPNLQIDEPRSNLPYNPIKPSSNLQTQEINSCFDSKKQENPPFKDTMNLSSLQGTRQNSCSTELSGPLQKTFTMKENSNFCEITSILNSKSGEITNKEPEVLVPQTSFKPTYKAEPPELPDAYLPCSEKQIDDEGGHENFIENSIEIIGEIFDTYILLKHSADEIILIDKHAAHERIIYEKLKSNVLSQNSQILLQPLVLTLEKEQHCILLENSKVLEQIGFEIEDFGNGSVIVRAAPVFLALDEIDETITEIAEKLQFNRSQILLGKLDALYHSIACRGAIKAGNKTHKEELIALIKKLKSKPELKYCPHGRPIFILLKKSEIEKSFGRT